MTDFHERNRASTILAQIGSGCADADFARAIHQCIAASKACGKASKVSLVVSIEVREDIGAVELRADVTAKTPKLKSPATQFHEGPHGELVSQQDFLLEKWTTGGIREPLAPVPPTQQSSGSGRLRIPVTTPADGGPALATLPPKAPLAPIPARAPLAQPQKES